VDKPKSLVRCAVYTRKSSEEGLEQSFNSLDAQREACVSFIASQKHEGWRLLNTHYDDGGFSGGTMERPALKRLLDDLQAGRIDTVVVYKVDRLTRALSDFAKIVEMFDAHKVSFVSVTQQFNTTTSMGRLTLNVLLSFAQFEREVTGERIRDKIAASKKKGMWMGGTVPLGYDVKHRKLIVNQREAKAVSEIYRRYLDLGCVSRLKLDLEQKGIRSKQRVSQLGTKSGGAVYSRGALYKILQNRMYIGEIDHRGQVYPGEQPGIVPREVWERVQRRLDSNDNAHRNRRRLAGHSLLAGYLFDECGNRFTPSHTNKNGKRYRYYVSQAAIKNPGKSHSSIVRIPAGELEHLVCTRLRSYFASSTKILDSIGAERPTAAEAQRILSVAQRLSERLKDGELNRRLFLQSIISEVVVHSDNLRLVLRRRTVEKALGLYGAAAENRSDRPLQIKIPFRFEWSRGATRIILPPRLEAGLCNRPVPSLVKAIARSYHWYDQVVKGELSSIQAIAKAVGCKGRYVRKIFPFAFLAPSLVESIVNGQQPATLKLSSVARKLPEDWAEQARAFA
jgi:site-specific DNA recombinase